MTVYLGYADLLVIAEAATGEPAQVRDRGLVESALYRPQASAFGEDAYPTVELKAAALLQSLASNHALVDGNKRTALLACSVFLDMNGVVWAPGEDAAVELMLNVANKHLNTVEEIAERLQP